MTIALAKEGADIAVVERVAEKGEAVAREIEKVGVRVLAIACDITDRAQVDAAVERTLAELGKIDILVNNATGVTIET